MLASCNGGIRFCRQTGANLADGQRRLRAKCWRLVTEAQGFAGNGAPTRPVPGRAFLFFGPGLTLGQRRLGARIPAKPCSFVPFAPSLQAFSALGRRRLGAQIPAKPCSFVPFAPSLRTFSALGRHGLGAQIPAKPCSFVPFAPSLRTFSALGRQWGANSSGCRLPASTRWKVSGRRLESRKGEWPRPFSFSSFPQ